jgi:hypothetical protein
VVKVMRSSTESEKAYEQSSERARADLPESEKAEQSSERRESNERKATVSGIAGSASAETSALIRTTHGREGRAYEASEALLDAATRSRLGVMLMKLDRNSVVDAG